MIELPEINLARRLIERRNLSPPVKVLPLAKEYAAVEILSFPVDVDGVCIDLKKPGKKPRILVNSNKSEVRIRFTLAHELGHVLIPWHVGTIVDEIDEIGIGGANGYREIESEANRFASELLMPKAWVDRVIERLPEPFDATKRVANRADVSFQAATFKVLQSLPPGHIFARISDGVVVSAGRSPGTLAGAPPIGSSKDPKTLFPWISPRSQQVGDARYYWWQFEAELPSVSANESEDWRELLSEIVADVGVPEMRIPKFKASVNAIIAFSNGHVKKDRTTSRVYEACLQRLHTKSQDDNYIAATIAHPKFKKFLSAKVTTLLV